MLRQYSLHISKERQFAVYNLSFITFILSLVKGGNGIILLVEVTNKGYLTKVSLFVFELFSVFFILINYYNIVKNNRAMNIIIIIRYV